MLRMTWSPPCWRRNCRASASSSAISATRKSAPGGARVPAPAPGAVGHAMTTKSEPQVDTLDVALDPADDAVELRDESDEIIDTLKRQLASLQGQLDQYRTSASGGSGAAPPAQPDPALVPWHAQLAPRLTP